MRRNEVWMVGLALALGACSSSTQEAKAPCRDSAKDDVVMAGRTAGAAAKTGAVTAWEGVKTGGKAAAGWVDEGSEGARENWNEGKRETRAAARENAREVEQEANVPECP